MLEPEHSRDELSPRDDYGDLFPAWWEETEGEEIRLPASERSVSSAAESLSQTPRRYRLIWVLCLLVTLLILPNIVKRIKYAYTFGAEQARADVARQELKRNGRSFNGLAATSRLVSKAVGPSVVHIRTVRLEKKDRMGAYPFLNQYQSHGQGSGVIIDEAGYIVTNSHVVLDAGEITAQLVDGREVPARIIGADILTDLAVLKIDAPDLIATPWGDSASLEVGDMVWAVGSPYGLDRSVTFGIVSAKQRRGVMRSHYQDFLQTDAAINPGNSGGPLVDHRGQIIGINTAIVGSSYRGIGFAIPSDIAREVCERLRANGRISRGWLGVVLDDLNPEDRHRLSLDENFQGIHVPKVVPGSPADLAGIKSDDIILEWNGQPVSDPMLLTRMVAAAKVGSTVQVRVLSKGKERVLKVKIKERPARFG